jgi:hypothetical protein
MRRRRTFDGSLFGPTGEKATRAMEEQLEGEEEIWWGDDGFIMGELEKEGEKCQKRELWNNIPTYYYITYA